MNEKGLEAREEDVIPSDSQYLLLRGTATDDF
jgi:hypothetical protein